jgi:hypothetical protein
MTIVPDTVACAHAGGLRARIARQEPLPSDGYTVVECAPAGR